jgi:hypothetical protein
MDSTFHYPEIEINKTEDLVNPNGYFKLTFEQYYDIMHHTHKAEDIIGDSSASIAELTHEVNELKEIVAQLSAKINEPDLSDYDIEKEGVQDIEGNTIDPETGEIIEPANDNGVIMEPIDNP